MPNKRLTKGPGQKVLRVLLEDDDVAVFRLQLAVVLRAPHLDVEGLGRVEVAHEVEADAVADGAHVGGQVAAVPAEEGHLRLAELGGNSIDQKYHPKWPRKDSCIHNLKPLTASSKICPRMLPKIALSP